jgi:nitrite reductase (NADH) small subunit
MAGSAPTFTPVCALADIPRLGARVIERAIEKGGNVAVFRTAEDRVFALTDRCPHKGGPLSQGIVHGDRVACPLHNWNIRLETGTAVEPDAGCTARYPVRVENGRVEVALDNASVILLDSASVVPSDRA